MISFEIPVLTIQLIGWQKNGTVCWAIVVCVKRIVRTLVCKLGVYCSIAPIFNQVVFRWNRAYPLQRYYVEWVLGSMRQVNWISIPIYLNYSVITHKHWCHLPRRYRKNICRLFHVKEHWKSVSWNNILVLLNPVLHHQVEVLVAIVVGVCQLSKLNLTAIPIVLVKLLICGINVIFYVKCRNSNWI